MKSLKMMWSFISKVRMTQTMSFKREAWAMDPQKLIQSQCKLNIKTDWIFFLPFRYAPVTLMLLQFVFVPNIDWNYRFSVMLKTLKTSKWKTYFNNSVCQVRPSSDVAPFMRRTQCKLELKQWLFAHLHWVWSMKRATSELGLNLFLISSFWKVF